jgi:PTS system mannose-specific IIA component/D-glucosaminate-specific PTS system IIA component
MVTPVKISSKITAYIIVNHARFGEALIRSAEIIVGAMENVQALFLVPGIEPSEFFLL